MVPGEGAPPGDPHSVALSGSERESVNEDVVHTEPAAFVDSSKAAAVVRSCGRSSVDEAMALGMPTPHGPTY